MCIMSSLFTLIYDVFDHDMDIVAMKLLLWQPYSTFNFSWSISKEHKLFIPVDIILVFL